MGIVLFLLANGMIMKRYYITLLSFLFIVALPLSKPLFAAEVAIPLEDMNREQIIEETTIYTTPSELVLELKKGVKAVVIYDIIGREVFRLGALNVGRHLVSRDRLPESPALLLVRIVYDDGNTKTYKVRL